MLKKRSIAACVLVVSLLIQSGADAAMMAYLRMAGTKTGPIKGSVVQKGREDSIGVIAVEHEMSNDAKGKKHSYLIITKELDKSSPILYNVLASGETLNSFELKFWTPQIKAATGVGAEVQHYTIRLTNARIRDIKFKMDNIRNPELQKFAEYEEISFSYDKIEWIWTDGDIASSDEAKF